MYGIKMTREFYIPQGAEKIERAGVDGVVYTYTNRLGQLCAMGFTGKRAKPTWRHYFGNETSRQKKIEGHFDCCKSITDSRAARAAQRKAFAHTLKVGDILRATWGWEQTNIDYYEVTRVVGKQTVEVRAIGAQSEATESMQGVCVPVPGSFTGEAMRRRVSSGNYVRIDSSRRASPVEYITVGEARCFKPDRWTAYA